jgi:activator of HSP90 ATPase
MRAAFTERLGGKMTSERNNEGTLKNLRTRRQMIAGVAIAFGAMAAGSKVWAKTQQQSMKEAPRSAANEKRTSFHLETEYKASPERIYNVLLDSKQFAALTGIPAEIDPKAGGAFSMFGGMIVGRNVELVTNQRIVQAWRPAHWDPGVYSIVKFELKSQEAQTILVLVLDHTGFPEGDYDSLASGWLNHYIDPLKKFLA